MTDPTPPLQRMLFWKGKHDDINQLRGEQIWNELNAGSFGVVVMDVSQEWEVAIAYDLVFVPAPSDPFMVGALLVWPGRLIVDVYFDLDWFPAGTPERGLLEQILCRADCVTASPGANQQQLADLNPRVVLLPDVHDIEQPDAYVRALMLAFHTAFNNPRETTA